MTITGEGGERSMDIMSQRHSHQGVINMDVCASSFTLEFSAGTGNNSSTVSADIPLNPADFSALMVTVVLSFIIGIMGNSLALGVLYKMRSKHSEMRKSVFYVLVEGLVWTDLLGIIFTAPITVITYVMYPTKWLCAHPYVCKYGAFAGALFGVVTPLIICTLTIERLFSINYPYTFSVMFTQSKAKLAIVMCWGVGVFVASLPLIGFGKYELQYPHMWCFLNWHAETPVDTAYALIYAFINVLTMVTLIVSSITVILTLLKMRSYRRSSIGSARQFDTSTSSHVAQKQREVELQMVWFIVGIMFVYIVCWSPLIVQIIINSIAKTKNYNLDVVAIRLACLNQILDPWVYILLRKRCVRKTISLVLKFLHLKRKRRVLRRRVTRYRQRGPKCPTNFPETPFPRKLSQESWLVSSDNSKGKDVSVKPLKRLLYSYSPGDTSCKLSCVYETVLEGTPAHDIPAKTTRIPKPFSYPFCLNAAGNSSRKYRTKDYYISNHSTEKEMTPDNSSDIADDDFSDEYVDENVQKNKRIRMKRASSLVHLEKNDTRVTAIKQPKLTNDSNLTEQEFLDFLTGHKNSREEASKVTHLNIMSMYTVL